MMSFRLWNSGADKGVQDALASASAAKTVCDLRLAATATNPAYLPTQCQQTRDTRIPQQLHGGGRPVLHNAWVKPEESSAVIGSCEVPIGSSARKV